MPASGFHANGYSLIRYILNNQKLKLDKKIADLQSRIDEQGKAISLVKEKSEKISAVAKSLFSFPSQNITSITSPAAAEILRSQNAELVKDRGILFLKINDEKIQIKAESSFPAIASTLYNEAKKQSSAIGSIASLKTKNQKELDKLTQEHVEQIEKAFARKEQELLEV